MRAFALATLVALIAAAAPAGPRQACDYSRQMQGVSCLVMVAGRIAHEVYDGAGAADRAWDLSTGTASFSGVAAAAAVQDGLFRLDDPVADILTEWQADARRAVTIRQLLQLVSGIEVRAGPFEKIFTDHADAMALPLVFPPGNRFAEAQAPFQIFAALMERKLGGETYHAWLQRRIMDPLGITLEMPLLDIGDGPILDWDVSWYHGARMTARDWAVFGEFVRLGGVWDGRQLVDPDALAANFQGTQANPNHGMTWWIRPTRGGRVPAGATQHNSVTFYRAYAADFPAQRIWIAAGQGSQRLYILPDSQITAVRQTAPVSGDSEHPYSELEFLRLLLQ